MATKTKDSVKRSPKSKQSKAKGKGGVSGKKVVDLKRSDKKKKELVKHAARLAISVHREALKELERH